MNPMSPDSVDAPHRTRALKDKQVATVVLNYNSDADVQELLPQLAMQVGIRQTIIVVDNASKHDCVERLLSWARTWRPDAAVGDMETILRAPRSNEPVGTSPPPLYLVLSPVNGGYSAGNNIGIQLADALGADAVLIANPDMRIDDAEYVAELARALFGCDRYRVAGSRILGLGGEDQNPLREPTFWEELFWPRWLFGRFFKPATYVLNAGITPREVPKVSGCCLMIKMNFLRQTEYLDENVFLYCEEPILSARVRSSGGATVYAPQISAIHAHRKSDKGDPVQRMTLLLKSRAYYLKNYSGYRRWQLHALSASHRLLALAHRARHR
jgi:GT2 family glycosyltransferase